MVDFLSQYRACGAECRDDYLRQVAHDNGLPLACVRRIADQLGEREDFRVLVLIREERRVLRALKNRLAESSGQFETFSDGDEARKFPRSHLLPSLLPSAIN